MGSLDEIRAAAEALRALGPRTVIVTSTPVEGGVGLLTATGDGAWLSSTPRVGRALNGAGDFVAALVLAGLLKGSGAPGAAARAAGAAWAAARSAERMDRDDLPVVLAQAEWQGAAAAEIVRLG